MAEPHPVSSERFVVHVPCAIRSCSAHDLRALEWQGCFRDHRAIIERTFAQAERREQLMWIADVQGFPAGQLWLDLRLDRIWAARVIPPLQGRGIGARLVQVAERALAARGRARISVAVEVSNARALRFWNRQGYRPLQRIVEPWSYDTPDGRHVEMASELDVLEKELTEAHHAGHPLDDR